MSCYGKVLPFTGLKKHIPITPCSTVLLEKLTDSQLVKEFPAFHGTRRFITAFKSASHLSYPEPEQFSPYFPISSILILYSHIMLRPFKWSVSIRYPHHNPVCTSPVPHTCCMPRPSHSSLFDYPVNISAEYRSQSSSSVFFMFC